MKFGRASDRDFSLRGAPQTPVADADFAEVEAARRGDLDAFDRLVARHQNRIFNVCRWIIGDDDDAADAAQEAFVRAFRFLPKFRGDASFATWLSHIATNVARDFAKKRQGAPRSFSTLANDEDPDFEPQSEAISPDESLLKNERQRAVQAALSQIPIHFRTVLVLYDLQGHSYEECAALLELPLGTVKSRLSRARLALREALGSHRELFEN
ncbi:RNA polymerase sigma-70 factor, ECF subfamily [Abditibacterium utsteinense]|uniref:RNA polymerase sigma-70 factor, ECF subfamily n=1 Tax=Abditibacterium utsteinense TaxID=1960156 RepID=A0A2S8SXD3_9BACT|nr:sigma-70 family RNA polymerase sigma factor [Abditibacterium utsteinense]PQV65446.1 RNA polymerase sigma-70 factor, ECF subfamily [Abditibacterium utsteinense]